MNTQVASAIRSVLKVGGGWLLARGISDNSHIEAAIAGLVALAGIVWSWWEHSTKPTSD